MSGWTASRAFSRCLWNAARQFATTVLALRSSSASLHVVPRVGDSIAGRRATQSLRAASRRHSRRKRPQRRQLITFSSSVFHICIFDDGPGRQFPCTRAGTITANRLA